MKNRRFVLTIVIAILTFLCIFLTGCGVETPGEEAAPMEEPAERQTCQSEEDYVWTDTGELEDWTIRIIIPEQLGCLKVDASKANLSLDEMLELDTSGHTPTRAVINFCVAEVEGECAYREFDMPLLMEVKDYETTDEILLYDDGGTWRAIRDQGRENGLGWAKIYQWAADPAVAWGF